MELSTFAVLFILNAVVCTLELCVGFALGKSMRKSKREREASTRTTVNLEPTARVELLKIRRQASLLASHCREHRQTIPESVARTARQLDHSVKSFESRLANGSAQEPVESNSLSSTTTQRLTAQEMESLSIEPRQMDLQNTWSWETKRFQYETLQEIGPCVDGRLPEASEFFKVQCYDLSTSGISVFVEVEPNWESAVISLGKKGTRFFMMAELRNRQPMFMYGTHGYLVGLRFIERLDATQYEGVGAIIEPQTALAV